MKDGVVNILKPPGMTSNDVVYDVRRALSIKRVGHTGTLDPGACGVLPVCVGKATKLFDYLVDKEKEYIAELKFGLETDTLDAYGRITGYGDKTISRAELERAAKDFTGNIEQLAPMYSAVSINGERLYKLARKGIEVERTVRKATIYGIDIIKECSENCFLLKIRCSKGTYIRTLCSDIAHALGTSAYVSFLLRSASGMFKLNDALSIYELNEAVEKGEVDEYILPVDKALTFMPEVRFCDRADVYKKLINGASIDYRCPKTVRVYYNDSFMGIGECTEDKLHIKTLFCEV